MSRTAAVVVLLAHEAAVAQSANCLCPAVAELQLGSLGLGTYLGAADDATDEQVIAAVMYSATRGWNVIDTGEKLACSWLTALQLYCAGHLVHGNRPRCPLPLTSHTIMPVHVMLLEQ